MWTLVLRAEINEDFTVTKHIHLLEKDVNGNIFTPHAKFEYESFIDVANVIVNQSLDVSNREKFEYEEKLTDDELANDNVQTALGMMNTTELE